jgi:hypothetical protein
MMKGATKLQNPLKKLLFSGLVPGNCHERYPQIIHADFRRYPQTEGAGSRFYTGAADKRGRIPVSGRQHTRIRGCTIADELGMPKRTIVPSALHRQPPNIRLI